MDYNVKHNSTNSHSELKWTSISSVNRCVLQCNSMLVTSVLVLSSQVSAFLLNMLSVSDRRCCYHLICCRTRRSRSPRCCREGRAALTYWISMSHISSPAGLPSPAQHPIFSVKPSDPSVPVAVTFKRRCHPRRLLMSSPDALSIQVPKSSASPCLMTRWTGVRTGHSIVRSATQTKQC